MPSHLGHGMHVPYLDRGPKAITEYHTLTNLPFERRGKLQNRYGYVTRPSSVHMPLAPRAKSPASARGTSLGFVHDTKMLPMQDSQEDYACFLRENERTLGPAGFLDSKKYNHTFNVRGLSVPSTKAGVSSPRRPESESMNVTTLAHKTAAYEKEFERRMKIIEDHMWQHKQEEREIKRVEGDVNKKKRLLDRTMREYENMMSKKMLDEEKRLNSTIAQSEEVKVDATRAKEDRTKQRIAKAHEDLQQNRAKMRKNAVTITDAERQYKMKLLELENRRFEIDRLTREFENKLKLKENASHQLSKELSELALSMNMEAMNGRKATAEHRTQERKAAVKYIAENRTHDKELDKKLAKSDGLNRAAQNRRRQHSANLAQKKEFLSERGREGDRRVTDTKNMMENNIANQKKLKEDKDAERYYKQKKQYERNVEEHVHRKNMGLQRIQNMRREIALKRGENWEETYASNLRDFNRKRNDGVLRSLQRVVKTDAEVGPSVSKKCRLLTGDRLRQQQALKKMEEQLIRLRARNTSKVRIDISEADSKEHDLERQIAKTRAELFRAQHLQNSAEQMVRSFGNTASESKRVYDELSKEQQRLIRIGTRTDTYLEHPAIPTM